MTNYREILRLRSLGVSLRNIAETLKYSKQTVITVCHKAAESGVSWPLPDGMTNEELSIKFFPRKGQPDMSYEMPDCDWIHTELQKPNVTLSLLWYESQNGIINYLFVVEGLSLSNHCISRIT